MRADYPRNVVITGAASGLGRELAINWARKGWKIGVTDIEMDGAAQTLDLVREAGGSGDVFRCDVRDLDQVRAMADHFYDAWGSVGVIVLNAGVADVGYVGEIKIENWKRIIDTGIWGIIHGCHTFIPRLKEQGRGHVVITASAAGLMSLPEMAPYNMVKAAGVAMAQTLAGELASFGLGVTAICPTFFNTGLLDSMTYTDEWEYEFAHACFDNSRITADQVAKAVVKAVEKNKLYVVPQLTGKMLWWNVRMVPSLSYKVVGQGMRSSIGKPLFMWMAKHGLI